MAAGGPATAAVDVFGVVDFTDEKLTGLICHALDLRVAFEAKVVVAFRKQLAVHGTVRIVAGGATFAEGFVLVNEGAGLLAVTLGALLVEARHRQSRRRLHNLVAVGIVTLHAIHSAFDDWMMLREVELGVDIQVALEAGGRILAGVDDEAAAAAADFDMLTGGAVAGFAAGDVSEPDIVLIELSVGAGGENAGDVGVALDALGVADVAGAFDVRRRNDGPAHRSAGDEHQGQKNQSP